MKATNDRLAKLEQMYEELTILEQKAVTSTMKGETSKFGDPKFANNTTKAHSRPDTGKSS